MNLYELRTFLVVAESGSVSTAAAQLHLSQPAISRRIQNLEQTLDTLLFNRIGKRMSLTEAGRLLMPQARSLLDLWRNTEKEIRNLSQDVAGPLHVATSHHIGLHRLAPVLAQFRDEYPDVELNLTFEDSEVTHQMVQAGNIELAVATLDPSGGGTLKAETVWHDPLIFVDAQAGEATLSQLASRPCVLPDSGTYTGRIVMERFTHLGLPLQPIMSTNYLETIGMLVSVGLGWSVLPASMQGELERIDVIDIGRLGVNGLSRELGIVTNPAKVLGNAAQAFIATLRAHA